MIYQAGEYIYDFGKFNTVKTFGEDIYNRKITLGEADEDQSDLVDEIMNLLKK